jgi:anti-sigma factor RsiW
MTHPTDDTLLLAAYDELAAPAADEVAAHLARCAGCRERFARLERARVAVDLAARPAARRPLRLVALAGALAAAAALALVLLRGGREAGGREGQLSLAVPRYAVPELAPIDSLLTRLEQERPYALP